MNAEWWELVFASIVARDAETLRGLEDAGWWPLVVWQHEGAASAVRRIHEIDRQHRSYFLNG